MRISPKKFLLILFGWALLADAQQVAKTATGNAASFSAISHIPPDFSRSAYTGYTRKHWLAITERIIAGALAHFNPQSGLPEFAVPDNDTAYERLRWKAPEEIGKRVLERMMMAVIVYAKATGKDGVPGYDGSISAPFLKAIIAGTDPLSKHYWGEPLPNDQVGSVFAMAVYIDPQRWWNPLTAVQKANLLAYLKKIAYISTYDNNHYFFHTAPAALLDKAGVASNREHLTKMGERLMGWYRGDGWFLDGSNRTFDYYNLWGFQLFQGVLYKYDAVWRRQFGGRVKATTARFLKTFPYLFGRDGGLIPWGRSLAYRFACNSAIAWAVLNNYSTLPPGEARRIASGSLKYFWERGCADSTGKLTLGYWGANASVAETYLYYGDVYWACQGLVPLLIPESDPFWTAQEEAIPADKGGGGIAVEGAQFSLRVSAIDGEARMFPAGQSLRGEQVAWQPSSKYDQHAYSSYLGFCLAGDDAPGIGAGRSGYSYNGVKWYYRERATPIQVTANHLISRYTLKPATETDAVPEHNREEMITHTLIGRDGEVHIFWHTNPEPLYLYLGGYGISVNNEKAMITDGGKENILIHEGDYYSVMKMVRAPEGTFENTLLMPRPGWSATHLFGGYGAFPHWQSTKPFPPNVPVAFYVNGTRSRKPVAPLIELKKVGKNISILFEGERYAIKVPF